MIFELFVNKQYDKILDLVFLIIYFFPMVLVREALNQAFIEAMEEDPMVIIIGEEIGASGGPYLTTKGLLDRFGNHRIIDTPISEIGFTGMAVGASFLGLRPVVDFMNWNFSFQSMDHIINSAAKISYMSSSKIKSPIVFRGPSGFNPGDAAQHIQELYNYYGCIPGLKVVAPYTANDHKRLMKSAIKDDNPVVFIENQILYKQNFDEELVDHPQELDKSVILQYGKDITIIGISLSLNLIISVKNKTKYDIEIINLISIRPLDMKCILKSVKKTKRLIIVDYSWPQKA